MYACFFFPTQIEVGQDGQENLSKKKEKQKTYFPGVVEIFIMAKIWELDNCFRRWCDKTSIDDLTVVVFKAPMYSIGGTV